jgi:stage V sporulation protein B
MLKHIFQTYLSVFSQSKYVLLLNITDKLFSFIIMLLLARHFSTEIYGQVVTIFTLTTVFITIFDLGLPIYLQRAISVDNSKGSVIFSKVFSISLILFAVYFLFSLGYLKLFYNEIPLVLFSLISVMMYTSSLVTICNKALSGLNNFKSQFIAFTIPRILILAGFIIGIYSLSFNLNLLMTAMLAGLALNLVIIFFYLNKSGIIFSLHNFSLKDSSSIFKLSVPLGLAVIFNFLYDKIDILLISKLLDFTEVAFYNVGYGLFKAGTLSFSFLLVAGFTKVASFNRNKVDITLFFTEYFKIIIIICILVSTVMFFAAEPLIKLLYTGKFIDSVGILKILSTGIIAVGLNNLTGITLNGMGYFKIVMYITLYGLILNVILNIVFIPLHGIIAAGVITVVTEYFIFFTEFYYLRKILKA